MNYWILKTEPSTKGIPIVIHEQTAVPGVECVAAADLYDRRHESAKEALGGKDIETTRNYMRLLDRKDIDAIIVATPDHWHRKVVVDACAAGKPAVVQVVIDDRENINPPGLDEFHGMYAAEHT